MPAHKYLCKNLANCDKALTKEELEIDDGEEAVCPECKQKLDEIKSGTTGTGGGGLQKVLIAVGVLIVLCVMLVVFWPKGPDPDGADKMITDFYPNLPPGPVQ